MFVDVKKAHLNGIVNEDEFAYVVLPQEAGGGVARLKRYGMRPAANACEKAYSDKMIEAGFVRGSASTSTFMHMESGVRVVVWGDDFTFLGREADLRDMAEKKALWFEVKVVECWVLRGTI